MGKMGNVVVETSPQTGQVLLKLNQAYVRIAEQPRVDPTGGTVRIVLDIYESLKARMENPTPFRRRFFTVTISNRIGEPVPYRSYYIPDVARMWGAAPPAGGWTILDWPHDQWSQAYRLLSACPEFNSLVDVDEQHLTQQQITALASADPAVVQVELDLLKGKNK